jgi:hypothetical protein
MGPVVGIEIRGSDATRWEIQPADGLKPTIPQNDAGFRRDPPRSEPSATDREPQASADAAPPLEPPALRDGSHGFRVTP